MFRKCAAIVYLLGGFLVFPPWLSAQMAGQAVQPAANREAASLDDQIATLRSDLRSNRKQIVAANMTLTPEEAEKFWPIYEQYVNELVNINNAKYALIKEYLQNTNVTEEQADSIAKR